MDDRCRKAQWPKVQGPIDVIVLEGWCVGASPEPLDALKKAVNALERKEDTDARWRRFVNESLAGPYHRLFRGIDLLILLAAPSFDVVHRWRCEQEIKLRKERVGRSAPHVMNATQLRRFIQHYERLTRHILVEMPHRADIVIRLDHERRWRRKVYRYQSPKGRTRTSIGRRVRLYRGVSTTRKLA
jgi:D-glycerate 3-kinase